MDKRIFFHPERCLLCQSCVLACQIQSLRISDITEIPRAGRPVQRLVVTFSQGTPWLWKCQQCVSAPCVEACVSGSMHYGEGRRGVIHDRKTCIACGACLLACPNNALAVDEEDGRVAKCNLCPQEAIPPCVIACQTKALVYQEPGFFAREKEKRFVIREKMYGDAD